MKINGAFITNGIFTIAVLFIGASLNNTQAQLSEMRELTSTSTLIQATTTALLDSIEKRVGRLEGIHDRENDRRAITKRVQ